MRRLLFCGDAILRWLWRNSLPQCCWSFGFRWTSSVSRQLFILIHGDLYYSLRFMNTGTMFLARSSHGPGASDRISPWTRSQASGITEYFENFQDRRGHQYFRSRILWTDFGPKVTLVWKFPGQKWSSVLQMSDPMDGFKFEGLAWLRIGRKLMWSLPELRLAKRLWAANINCMPWCAIWPDLLYLLVFNRPLSNTVTVDSQDNSGPGQTRSQGMNIIFATYWWVDRFSNE